MFTRKVNVRFLIVLVLIVAALGTGVHFLHAYQIKRNSRTLLELANQAGVERQEAFQRAEQAKAEKKTAEEKEHRAQANKKAAEEMEYLQLYLGYEKDRPNDEDVVNARARFAVLLDEKLAPPDRKGRIDPRKRQRPFDILEDVLRRDDGRNRHDLRRRVVDMAMDMMMVDPAKARDAKAHIKYLLEEVSPQDAELESKFAECELIDKKPELAAEWYEKAIRHDPKRVDDYYRRAVLLRRHLDRRADARQVIDELVEANPNDFHAYLRLAQYLREFGGAKPGEDIAKVMQARTHPILQRLGLQALAPAGPSAGLIAQLFVSVELAGSDAFAQPIEAAVVRALQLAPDEEDVLLAAAQVAWEKGDFDTARRHLQRGIKLESKSDRFYHALALLELSAGKRDDAVKHLEAGIKAVPGSIDLHWTLADVLVNAGKRDRALEVMATLKKLGFSPESLDYLTARLRMQDKQWQEASEILERVYPSFTAWRESPRHTEQFKQLATALDREANLALGTCYEQIGDLEEQLKAYNRALRADPSSLAARASRANTLTLLGRYEESLAEYQELRKDRRYKDPGNALSQIRLMLLRNLRMPASAVRDWQPIEKALADAEKAVPDTLQLHVLRAELQVAQGKLEDARASLERVAANPKHAKSIEVWATLANVYLLLKEPKKSLEALDKAQEQIGDTPTVRIARVHYWSRQNAAEARPVLAKLAEDVDKFSTEDQVRLLMAAGEAFTRAGDPKEAERMWSQVVKLKPHDLKARVILFDFFLAAGDEAKMANHAADIRKLEGEDGARWRYAEAARLIYLAKKGGDKRGLAQAHVRLMEAASRRPDWPRIPLLLSELEDVRGKPDLVIEHLQKAVDLGDMREVVVRRLVLLLYDRRRYDEAERALSKLENQTGDLSDEMTRTAAVLALEGDKGRAFAMVNKAVPASSKDFRDQLWRGRMMVTLEKWTEAELAFREAVTLAPKVPYGWLSLVRFHIRAAQGASADLAADQRAKAGRALEEARKNIPEEQAPLALALCHEALGNVKEAEVQHKAALSARPNDPPVIRSVADFYIRSGQFPKAEPLLLKLEERDFAPAADVAWARRNRALAMATGEYAKFQEALLLLDKNMKDGNPSTDDLRAKAILYAFRNYRAARRQAISILEDLNKKRPLGADDRFLLAELHEADGNWPRAKELLSALVAERAKNPYSLYLARYAAGLLRHSETREEVAAAVPHVTRLEELQPQAFGTVELKARLLKKQGNDAEAVAALRKFGEKPEANLRQLAGLLEELEQYQAADEFWEKYLFKAKQPENVLLYAQFLARRKRPKDALDICERARQTCQPEAVGAASVAIIYLSGADEPHSRRVARWIEEDLRSWPKSTPLLMQLADLRNLQNNFQEAEKLYRDVLKTDPNHRTALNNLAWLLAFQPGKGDEALSHIQKVIGLVGPATELLDTRGMILFLQGNMVLAVKDLEESAGNPTPSHCFHLALAYHKAGNRAEAVGQLQKAKSLGLTPDKLHGLERPLYEKLLSDLGPQ